MELHFGEKTLNAVQGEDGISTVTLTFKLEPVTGGGYAAYCEQLPVIAGSGETTAEEALIRAVGATGLHLENERYYNID